MNINMAKAYFILLVIIDHNNLSRVFIGDFLQGFTFHVVGFFSLYLINQNENQQNYVGLMSKSVVRYLYPYTLFVIGLSLVMYLAQPSDLASQAILVLKALYTGNYIYLKQSTNMYLLWFLPAFVSFVCLVEIYKKARRLYPNTILLCIFTMFLVIPFFSVNMQQLFPLGGMTACYILTLAVVINYLYTKFRCIDKTILFILFPLFILVKYFQVKLNLTQEIGFLVVTTIEEPIPLIFNALESIFGVLLVFYISALHENRFMNTMGRYSLQVYLLHAFVAVAVWSSLRILLDSDTMISWLITISLTALSSTYLAIKIMNNKLLLRYLFPKDFKTLSLGVKHTH